MRDLKLPALYQAHPLLTTQEDFDEGRDIRRASGRIISATSAIDQVITEIIANTIFREIKVQRELVLGSVLQSDWCTLAAKRKLLTIAVEKFNLLDGQEKNTIESSLKKVSQYRNAFAHGTLSHDGEVQAIHYFEGRPRTDKLDDTYFEKLEHSFLTAWQLLEKVNRTIEDRA